MTITTDGGVYHPKVSHYGLFLSIALLLCTGCAAQTGSARIPTIALEQQVAPTLVATAAADITLVAAASPKTSEEPFDPFAKPGEEGIDEYDPWEPVNTHVFEFNRQVDRWVLKPVAKGYNFIMPNMAQVGVSNFFYNLRFPSRFANNAFQGKVKGAGIEVGRFLVNTTAGVAGFFDVAEYLNLKTPEEDTGQTLGFYGVKPGPYLILPLLQPFTLRDFIGYIGDIALNPINWFVLPIIEVHNIPSVLPHSHRVTVSSIQMSGRVFEIVNDRSLNLEKFQGVEEATLDLYTAVRNAYLQKRAKAIQE
jgi:phospholipid-binding lipoprotein MlaA